MLTMMWFRKEEKKKNAESQQAYMVQQDSNLARTHAMNRSYSHAIVRVNLYTIGPCLYFFTLDMKSVNLI